MDWEPSKEYQRGDVVSITQTVDGRVCITSLRCVQQGVSADTAPTLNNKRVVRDGSVIWLTA